MKKVSYVIMNALLVFSIVMLILIFALYRAVAGSANGVVSISEPSVSIAFTIVTILMVIAIIALILINIVPKPIVQTAGAYLLIIYGILLIISFFMFFYIGIVNIFVGVGLIVFSSLLIRSNNVN